MAITCAHAVLLVGGKYAMQIRDQNTAVYPGGYGLFGGSIEPGESSLQALIRELHEELELEIEPSEARHLGDWEHCRFFVVDVGSRWEMCVVHEGAGAELMDLQQLLWATPVLNDATWAAIQMDLLDCPPLDLLDCPPQ